MTKDEILNIPDGREMDALISRDVFGMKIDKTFKGEWVVNPTYTDIFGKHQDTAIGWPPNSYSTNISVAWEVVEFLKRNFWSTEIICWDFSERWVVTCEYRTGHGEPKKTLYADAETPMLAICRAALLSVNQ
jgi:hypothetical protein